MPPRKSNVSTVSNGAEENTEPAPTKASRASKDELSVEDLSLPRSMIARLAKGVLPANTQIQKDALLALHKSATVFVSYIASNSNELAQAGGKKTISPQDVLASLKDAELESFIPRLEAELKKYNETQCDKRNSYRHRVKKEKAATGDTSKVDAGDDTTIDASTASANGTPNGHGDVEDGERPAKKLKGQDGVVVVPAGEAPEDDDEDDDEAEDGEEDGEQDEDGEEGEEDGEEGDDGEDEAEAEDETMEDPDEEEEIGVGGEMDEALDEPDSD